MLESVFQSKLIKELEEIFPGCIILKNDANYIQGFPDLLILYKKNWAVLECKKDRDASFRPNQEYYLELLGEMSYASVIYPEIKEEVLDELQKAFRARRSTRISKC
jgi:hypothetical protein